MKQPKKGAQVVVLQELFRSLYFCDVEDYENFKLAEAIPGPSTDSLGALAKELGVVIVASLFEKRAEGLYHNTTAVLDADGTYLGKYRKNAYPGRSGLFLRSFTSLRVTWATRFFQQSSVKSAC